LFLWKRLGATWTPCCMILFMNNIMDRSLRLPLGSELKLKQRKTISWPEIFQQIWNLAVPYYKKARSFDLQHVKWVADVAREVCEKEQLDPMTIETAAVLHDIGYSGMGNGDYTNPTVKIRHMQRGVRMAGEILTKVSFPRDIMLKVLYIIGEHDDWALGIDEVYQRRSLVGVLGDLDFLYLSSPEGFEIVRKDMKKTPQEMIFFLKNHDKHIKRPWATKTTLALFEQYISEREKLFEEKL